MMVLSRRKTKGFNLVETVVASVVLSATALVVIASSTMSMSLTKLNRQYEMAGSIIDKQFCLIDFIGIDGFVDMGELSGEVAEFEPGYYWEIETEYQDIDSLYLVTITVSWIDRGRPYSLTVDTMLDGMSTYIELEEEAGEEMDSDTTESSGGSSGGSLGGSSGGR